METSTPVRSGSGRSALRRRLGRTLAVALALTAVAGPAVAQADDTSSGSTWLMTSYARVDGARADVDLLQAANGGLYFHVVLRDEAVDGHCAHISFRWRHENGHSYYDREYICGAGNASFFNTPTRNWTKYRSVRWRIYTEVESRWSRSWVSFAGDRIDTRIPQE